MAPRPLPPPEQIANMRAAVVPFCFGQPLAPQILACGARTRTGGLCALPALAGGRRCLRHAGPTAARAYRARQLKGLETGGVSPAEFARAEARRARNHLTDQWERNPARAGETIDLGANEGRFRDAASALGVSVDGLLPAVVDWLRWRFKRHQIDRQNGPAWVRAATVGLIRQRAKADQAMEWVGLGGRDKRTRAGRAIKAALRAGGLAQAQAVADAITAAEADAPREPLDAYAAPSGALTAARVEPWKAREGVGAKRRQPDRPKRAASPRRAAPRPAPLPDTAGEIEALAAVLRGAGAEVRAMFGALSSTGERAAFLQDLADVTAAPEDAGARRRWLAWVSRFR